MAVVPVYVQAGDPAYVEGIHFEGYAETRDDVAAFTTDYGIGSLITCSEDWSLWLLGTSSGTKTWLEVDPQEDPQEETPEEGS